MKKLVLAMMSFFMTFALSNAQNITPRVEVDATLGKLDHKLGSLNVDTKLGLGFRAGAGVEYNLAKGIYLYSGLNYTLANSKFTEEEIGEAKIEIKETLHYLSIPVNLGARANFGKLGFSGEFGPYFAYGIAGNLASNVAILGSKDIKAGSYDPFKDTDLAKSAYKRFDMGVGASVAVEYSKFYLRLGTEYGLYNFANLDGAESKRFNVYTGIGVRF